LQNLRGVLIVVSVSVACPHTSLLNCPVCAARFCWSLWTRSHTFAALVSKPGFLKQSPRPPLGTTCRGRAGATSRRQN